MSNPIDDLMREHGMEPLPSGAEEGEESYPAPFDESAWERATAELKDALGRAPDQAACVALVDQAVERYIKLVGQQARAPADSKCA